MRDSMTVDLRPRDYCLLCDLLESRVMSLSHIAKLHFSGLSPVVPKKRVAKLKAAGLIAERPRRGFEPSVLFLTRQAFQILQEHGHLADYPNLGITALERRGRVSDLTIHHELEIMDIKVAFAKAVAELPGITLRRITTWPRLIEFRASRVLEGFRASPKPIRPDGFILFETEDKTTPPPAFFLELDRGTENLHLLASKAAAYLDYYRNGGFALWRKGERTAYKLHPFRVLGVFKSEKRKLNFAQRLLENNPPIRHHWYLANLPDVIRDPVGTIWTTPADYAAGQPNGVAGPAARPLFTSEHKKAEQSG